jgi:hypothetical protein
MKSAEREIFWAQTQGGKFTEILGAQASELVEKLREGLAMAFAKLREAIEGNKRLGGARAQNHLGARHPVGAFAVDEVADDIEGGPSGSAFVTMGPGFREIAKKRVEGGGSALEESGGLGEFVGHLWTPSDVVRAGWSEILTGLRRNGVRGLQTKWRIGLGQEVVHPARG